MKIHGCVAVVTGGASGIGKAICQALAVKGAKVCVVDVNATAGDIFAAELQISHGEETIVFVQADVSSQEQLEGAFDKAKSKLGRIDVVVNNAGFLDEKNWRACVNINLVGMISGTMLAVNHMGKEHGGNGGVIINIASKAGLVPGPCWFIPTYAATKAAIIAHTMSWSANPRCKQEGFRFNVVCPTVVDTPFTQRMNQDLVIGLTEEHFARNKSREKMKPSRVADVVLELIEDDKKNGAIIHLDTDKVEQLEYPKCVVPSTVQ